MKKALLLKIGLKTNYYENSLPYEHLYKKQNSCHSILIYLYVINLNKLIELLRLIMIFK